MTDLINLTQAFLVTNGLLFTALAATGNLPGINSTEPLRPNEPLKTGLSLAGIAVSILWSLTLWVGFGELKKQPTYGPFIAYVLPVLFVLGWSISLSIHVCNWAGKSGPGTKFVTTLGILFATALLIYFVIENWGTNVTTNCDA